MEDVLDLYAEPCDPKRPSVCFDESPYQMTSEVRRALPAEPGRPERFDYEYKREGTCNLFLFFEPHRGWRHVEVTQRRTKHDFARCMKALVDEHYPEAERIRVVLDNLSTHSLSALYEVYEPAEARRLARKLELHPTPKHGSWLNMAEIEFSVLHRQCLDRRLGSIGQVQAQTRPWEERRNRAGATVRWQFTTADARVKLKRLYPS